MEAMVFYREPPSGLHGQVLGGWQVGDRPRRREWGPLMALSTRSSGAPQACVKVQRPDPFASRCLLAPEPPVGLIEVSAAATVQLTLSPVLYLLSSLPDGALPTQPPALNSQTQGLFLR